MKTILFSVLLLIVLSASAKTTVQAGKEPVIEGTVQFFEGSLAIGGEGDPAGYILSHPVWISGKPSYSFSRIYINQMVGSSFVGKRVRIRGDLDVITVGGTESPRRSLPRMTVKNVQALSQ